ncbi:ubiquinol-cytochrome c reductase complex assembly factor 4 isoform X2 [Chaetodon trifascialis]|uniref:ubiquinol-cytochrome c reductase complex assembly factor 4 isoform X2 n=1 Tax=Chaetodon trifascialis TaxID=109706 RepID=UPI0039968238
MSTTVGRVFTGLTRSAFSRRVFIHNASSTERLNSVRSLPLSSQRSAKSTDVDKEVNNEPIKFSTSKASHKVWKVDRSLGSQHQRPWWKVLPISLVGIGLLLWCVLREETDIDAQLNENLLKNLPGFLPDEEEEENK